MSIVEHEKRVEKAAELDEVSQVLVRAAEVIRQGGLLRGQSHDANGAHCMMGAVSCANGGSGYCTDVVGSSIIKKLLRSQGWKSENDLFRWNDAPGRTAEEVATALERAAYGL